jgi:methylthioribose-1-phosphate isomerase
MKINGRHYRTIWVNADGWSVATIDQTKLPHRFETVTLQTLADAAHAIGAMLVRGAPLIGATAAYGVCLAVREDPSDHAIERAYAVLLATRPTAVNLRWALDEMCAALRNQPRERRVEIAYRRAAEICDQDVETNGAIGRHGLAVLREIAAGKPAGEPLNVLTHCNAGWLATVDWGTATAPIYMAHDEGLPVHVWVDETRPRNQGASLTAWELGHHGVPHTVIADNAGGHLMQHGRVDLCIVGTDRTTATGDVANKIGTYLKALAAKDNGVPFYVALPSTTIDWTMDEGSRIPIEERSGEELSRISGRTDTGEIATIQVTPDGSPVANYAFDVTPARMVTGLITERGVAEASREGLAGLFPEHGQGGG